MLRMIVDTGIKLKLDTLENFLVVAMRGTKDRFVLKTLMDINNEQLLKMAEIAGTNFKEAALKNVKAAELLFKMVESGEIDTQGQITFREE